MSPAFLYRVESAPRGTEITLNDWEMASRMSFFLWSSIPDEELRRAAAAKELSDPKKLAAQVARMTADPKARRLSTEFFGQWLGFYHFDEYRGVDTGRFPEFTDDVRRAMYEESVATFEYLIRERRPVKEILHADYTFLNKPLAKFYGVDEKLAPTDTVQKVEGASKFDRGGALRLGSVLTTTSAPLRTSPVKRGDWILRRILSTPTPPPPPDAGTLPADDKSFEGQTLRQRLDRAQARRQVRGVPPAHRSARLPARGLRRGRPRRAPPTTTASRSTPPASSATSRSSSAPTACSATCRSRTRRC